MKINTEFRSSLSTDTLNALLIEKLKICCAKENFYQKTFSKQELQMQRYVLCWPLAGKSCFK